MVLSSAKAKTRQQAAMVAAGRAALEGVEEEEPKSEAITASAPVPALAPDTREQLRTRLLQQKLKRFQIEAVEGEDERPAKRQRVMEREVGVMDAESKQEDNILNLKDRVEKMEGEIAEEIAGETSNAARWIRKRLLLNLQERERLLRQFVEMKEKEKQASEKASFSKLGETLAASPSFRTDQSVGNLPALYLFHFTSALYLLHFTSCTLPAGTCHSSK